MADSKPDVRHHSFRMDEREWQEAKALIESRGENPSQVIRDALKRYVMRHAPRK